MPHRKGQEVSLYSWHGLHFWVYITYCIVRWETVTLSTNPIIIIIHVNVDLLWFVSVRFQQFPVVLEEIWYKADLVWHGWQVGCCDPARGDKERCRGRVGWLYRLYLLDGCYAWHHQSCEMGRLWSRGENMSHTGRYWAMTNFLYTWITCLKSSD